jgi:rhodanese-related sulfurtransferase
MTKQQFVALVTDGQPVAPGYFGYDATLNRQSRPLLDDRPLPAMDLAALDEATVHGAVVVDVRPAVEFASGHLAGSLGIPLDGRFAEQAGSVIDPERSIVLVGEADAIDEARVRLSRIGFDHTVGAVADIESILATYPSRARRLSRLTADAYHERKQVLGDALVVIDVRSPAEVAAAPVADAHNIPLPRLRHELAALDPSRPTVTLCAGGARSPIAASVLLAAGFDDVSDILGGATALGSGPACRPTSGT